MASNPYTLLFEKPPISFLPRDMQRELIIEEFTEERINEQAYVIVGLRGSGKTVFMTDVARKLEAMDNWIVVDLNAERNLLEDFVSSLNSRNKLASIFKSAKINLSYLGMGVEVKGVEPVTNIESAAKQMLESLKKKNKRVLVTVDEITNSKSVREFALAFQSFIRADLPIFFLSTGLYDNVRQLEEAKGSTFFMRTPKVEMGPLDLREIAENYKKTFHLEREEAVEMAKLTEGYSFAFQVLGHYTWNANGDYRSMLKKYENHLYHYSYEKIWSELSQMDKELAYGIAKAENGKISEIRDVIQWDANKIGPYRKRLIRRGLVNTKDYGCIRFRLPRFDRFVVERYEEDHILSQLD